MIKNLKIYTSFNEHGRETIKLKVITENGEFSSSVPSGTSKGKHEAKELPIKTVMKRFSEIRHYFITRDENAREELDLLIQDLDKTKNFSKLGENLALTLSISIARAATNNQLYNILGKKLKAEFPYPMGNVMGGGQHAGGTDFQEFLIIPYKAKTPEQAVKTMIDVWREIEEKLKRKKSLTGKNLENAWTSKMNDIKTLDFLSRIADNHNLKLGIDCAASNMWNGKYYNYRKLKRRYNREKQLDFMIELAKKYKLFYLEDPFHEEDFESFSILTKKTGKKCLVVGDDLFTTNPHRLYKGIKSANGIIIKPNQVGTLFLTQIVVNTAKRNGIKIIPSHRSGETEDDFIADLAIAWDAPLIKTGLAGADTPKLNRLIELWHEIPHVKMHHFS